MPPSLADSRKAITYLVPIGQRLRILAPISIVSPELCPRNCVGAGNGILPIMLVLFAAMAFLTGPSSDACTVVKGSVESLDWTPLPETPGLINMDVIWRYEIRVKRVLSGPKVLKHITFFRQSHAQPIYHAKFAVSRRADGTYEPCSNSGRGR